MPYSERDPVDSPLSLYAATKKSNEIITHSYSHLYDIPSTGMGFLQSMVLWVDQTWLNDICRCNYE